MFMSSRELLGCVCVVKGFKVLTLTFKCRVQESAGLEEWRTNAIRSCWLSTLHRSISISHHSVLQALLDFNGIYVYLSDQNSWSDL